MISARPLVRRYLVLGSLALVALVLLVVVWRRRAAAQAAVGFRAELGAIRDLRAG